jgi:hypothetical protein
MADPNDNENDETVGTTAGSAGEPQRMSTLGALGIMGEDEPTEAYFDARQAAMSVERKSPGPPLPEGSVLESLLAEAAGEDDQPTEVAPPRPQDR